MLVFVSLAVGVFAGLNWVTRVRSLPRLETVSKPAATVAITALAVVVGRDQPRGVILSALIGFILCLVGDIALLDAVDSFIAGLAAFLAGHVAFIAMFVQLGLDRKRLGAVGLVLVATMVTLVGRVIVRGARTREPKLAGPVVAYLTVISTMVVVGWATGNVAATIGATLFVISDAILGWRAFVGEKAWMSLAVMMSYHGALLGLALSLA